MADRICAAAKAPYLQNEWAVDALMERQMKTDFNVHGGGETAGTKFFTWAIIVVAAGLLVAMTTDFTSKPTTAQPATHTVETTTADNAS
jgi:hypothetical protein